MKHIGLVLGVGLVAAAAAGPKAEHIASQAASRAADVFELRSVGDVQLSPDGRLVTYTVVSNDRSGRPSSRLWRVDVATLKARPLGLDGEALSKPRWAPDGRRLLCEGRSGDRSGLVIVDAENGKVTWLADRRGTNHPLPTTGEETAWSPDGRSVAFVSAVEGPEQQASGDPMVITRYLYKPNASEGLTRFNDNRRLHIFVADIASGRVRQLTDGPHYEHSISWSPSGDEIVFVSNREADADRVFNNDLFAVRVDDGRMRQLTATRSAEYLPRWSPDGRTLVFLATKRPLTSSETTMEDTHVWTMDASGQNRRELGESIDNRQDSPGWSVDGRWVYFTVEQRGSVALYRMPAAGGAAQAVVSSPGAVRAWSSGAQGTLAFAFSGPRAPADLHVVRTGESTTSSTLPGRRATGLNDEWLDSRTVAEVEAFTFPSFDGRSVEAFLTKPARIERDVRHPLVVVIHGGPHAQQGPAFNHKAQVYAAQGWAVLNVNYRGSTGYGQAFADAIFGDQNGGEARDVLAGVDAALARYDWLDPKRLGIEGVSYGGQLTNWLVTRTTRFAAAIPIAGIANLVSFNYMAYYHDYFAVEFGRFPHEGGLMDVLWERSPLRYVHQVKTPVMLVHGENDNDVPIAEAEQFYIALKDVGIETIMVRYPREGHGIREPAHVVDLIDRSIAWYRRHFSIVTSEPG